MQRHFIYTTMQPAIDEAAGTGAPTEGESDTRAVGGEDPAGQGRWQRPRTQPAPLATCHRIGSRLGRRAAPDARDGDRRASASGDAAAAAARRPGRTRPQPRLVSRGLLTSWSRRSDAASVALPPCCRAVRRSHLRVESSGTKMQVRGRVGSILSDFPIDRIGET